MQLNHMARNSFALPLDDEQIADFEKEYGLQLPELLKEFYRKYNGRRIHPVSFQYKGQDFQVDGFIPLLVGSVSVDHILDIYRNANRIPAGWIPLAVSDSGDDYFLDSENGPVYLVEIDRPCHHIEAAQSLEAFFRFMGFGKDGQPET